MRSPFVVLFLSITCITTAEVPRRELAVPFGTALTGLGTPAMPFTAQSLWLASATQESQLIWSVPLGINIIDATADPMNRTIRYFLQSDGGFYQFNVFD